MAEAVPEWVDFPGRIPGGHWQEQAKGLNCFCNCKSPRFDVPGGSPLANIVNASATSLEQASELCPRRFRFGGKKEAAGAVVAVILDGIMDFEWHLEFWREIREVGFLLWTMDIGEPMAAGAAMWGFEDAMERNDGAVRRAERRLSHRRARSKPVARVGYAVHEVSKPLK